MEKEYTRRLEKIEAVLDTWLPGIPDSAWLEAERSPLSSYGPRRFARLSIFILIRGEGYNPLPATHLLAGTGSAAVIRFVTRVQYLMRTTYPAALRRGMLISAGKKPKKMYTILQKAIL
jgi:hypothetical protein